MDKNWFDLRQKAKRTYAESVWVPLCVMEVNAQGRYNEHGYLEDFEGANSVAVFVEKMDLAEESFGWSSDTEARPWSDINFYKTADTYSHNAEIDLGFRLALRQSVPDQPSPIWHLHQDFVIALELIEEGDSWVRPAENYVEVARLRRNKYGHVSGIEAKAEFLKDYLCARNCALRIASYRERSAVLAHLGEIDFPEEGLSFELEGGRLEERAWAIDQSGSPFGSTVSVFKMSRNDVDPDDDVPTMPHETNENVDAESWSFTRENGKNYRVMAQFWRDEWIKPAAHSVRVRNDKIPSQVSFVIDADGARASADDLRSEDVGRWLWFAPGVIRSLLDRRGATLEWYTRDTGGVSTPSDPSVHFGVNEIGLVTVYAHDIARLPEWERRFWAGFNLTPEGKVCAELLAAQVRATPARTQAPERYFPKSLDALSENWEKRFGTKLLRSNEHTVDILRRIHRFRAVDKAGLLALSKDVARLTADAIDASIALAVAPISKGERLGSLKAFERALSTICGGGHARKVTGPLFAAYDLRLSDAHLPKSSLVESFKLLGIDEEDSPLISGYKMLHAVVSSLNTCSLILDLNFPESSPLLSQ